MRITGHEVPDKPICVFALWDDEMLVHVTQHTGAHGFHSAALVVDRMDSPLEVQAWSGYKNPKPDKLAMRNWIARQINKLATGTRNATGTYGSIRLITTPTGEPHV